MSKPQEYWLNCQGIAVRYRVFAGKNSKGRVLLLPGFTEFVEKYQDIADQFNKLGFDALVIDWPGQGLSKKFFTPNPSSGQHENERARTILPPNRLFVIHCKDFTQHLEAITLAAEKAGFLAGNKPLLLFGHSMGGHLALRLGYEWAESVRAIILCAPMIMPPESVFLRAPMIKVLAQIACSIGFATYPCPGRAVREGRLPSFQPDNCLTRSPEGYMVQLNHWKQNPALKSYIPSIGWARAAYTSCSRYTSNPAWLKQLSVPIQAHVALDERVISVKHSKAMLPYIPQAESYFYEEAKHELLLELPEVRQIFWQRSEAFIQKHF